MSKPERKSDLGFFLMIIGGIVLGVTIVLIGYFNNANPIFSVISADEISKPEPIQPLHITVFYLNDRAGTYLSAKKGHNRIDIDLYLANELSNGYIWKDDWPMSSDRLRVITEYSPAEAGFLQGLE